MSRALLRAAAKRRVPSGDPHFASVIWLANYASDASDVKGHAVTLYGGASVSGGALVLDGNGDYATCANSIDWATGTQAFTVDGFVELTATPSVVATICETRATANPSSSGFNIGIDPSLCLRLFDGPATAFKTSSNTIQLNTKTAFRITFDGSFVRINLDGTVTTLTASSTNFGTSPASWLVGTNRAGVGEGLYDWSGKIYALRFTKGVARDINEALVDPFPEA